eukprot:IDg5340t1
MKTTAVFVGLIGAAVAASVPYTASPTKKPCKKSKGGMPPATSGGYNADGPIMSTGTLPSGNYKTGSPTMTSGTTPSSYSTE